MSKKLTIEEFINKSEVIHSKKYDYSLVEYKNSKSKVEIICKKHGSFFQMPNTHLSRKGGGCKKCANNTKLSVEEFIMKSKVIHNNKYSYDKVVYVGSHNKVEILCKTHGIFLQAPHEHLNTQGCPKCRNELLSNKFSQTIKNFIINAKLVHGEKYEYSLVNYVNSKTKIEIICKKHGSFLQNPSDHLKGCGCPNCQTSKGEQAVENYLTLKNIEFIKQKKFKGCYYKNVLPFDFYLPQLNICIEYNGEQHYRSVKHWGGEEVFKLLKHKDAIKREFCYLNNIHIIEIKYTDNVEEVLNFHIIKS